MPESVICSAEMKIVAASNQLCGEQQREAALGADRKGEQHKTSRDFVGWAGAREKRKLESGKQAIPFVAGGSGVATVGRARARPPARLSGSVADRLHA